MCRQKPCEKHRSAPFPQRQPLPLQPHLLTTQNTAPLETDGDPSARALLGPPAHSLRALKKGAFLPPVPAKHNVWRSPEEEPPQAGAGHGRAAPAVARGRQRSARAVPPLEARAQRPEDGQADSPAARWGGGGVRGAPAPPPPLSGRLTCSRGRPRPAGAPRRLSTPAPRRAGNAPQPAGPSPPLGCSRLRPPSSAGGPGVRAALAGAGGGAATLAFRAVRGKAPPLRGWEDGARVSEYVQKAVSAPRFPITDARRLYARAGSRAQPRRVCSTVNAIADHEAASPSRGQRGNGCRWTPSAAVGLWFS